MNIYEQLNKINDTESLSERYNVKNAKELKKLKESLKEDTHSMYSNRVEGNNRYFDTMGNKIRYCLLDVIRCKGYTALYRYMQSLDPDAFSAYAPDFTTKLGDQYQEDSVHINRADTFGKIADDLQQQFIKIVSRVDSRKHSVYEDKTPEELWNNSPVEIDGKQYAKVQNLKKKFDID